MVAISAILTKIAGSATKATKILTVGKKIGSGMRRGVEIIFDNTTMFIIIFGYLVYSGITKNTELWSDCLAPVTGGGILAVWFGAELVPIMAALCILWKVLVEPFTTIYREFISVEHLGTGGNEANRFITERIATLEPYISLIAFGAYIFFIIAIFKRDKRWMRNAGKVLLLLILIGMATNAFVYFYDILFSLKDFIITMFGGG